MISQTATKHKKAGVTISMLNKIIKTEDYLEIKKDIL